MGFLLVMSRTGQTCPLGSVALGQSLRSKTAVDNYPLSGWRVMSMCTQKSGSLAKGSLCSRRNVSGHLWENFLWVKKIPLVLNKYLSSHLWSLPPWSHCVIEMWFPYYYRIIFQLPRLVWISYIVKISVDNLLKKELMECSEMHSLS